MKKAINKTKYCAIIVTVIICSHFARANVIHVPADQPTIQVAIDTAMNGDTILVAPGIYYENLMVLQKNDLSIIGSGADVTTIDGSYNGHVVEFNGSSGMISRFTITHSGTGPSFDAGVCATVQSTLRISDNIIINNNIGILFGSNSNVFIQRNQISNCSDHGIEISYSTGVISDNLITNTSWFAIYIISSSPAIINNTIIGNATANYWGVCLNPTGTQIVANNIVENFDYGVAVLGQLVSAVPIVEMSYNDVRNNLTEDYWEEYGLIPGPVYQQTFSPQPGTGEIHQDPLFVDPVNGNFQLRSGSPCINAGDPDTTGLHISLTDLAGNSRIIADTIDIGAYEYPCKRNLFTSDSATICSGDSILLGGSYQKTAGIYYDTIPTAKGCDSVVITTLMVNQADTSVTNNGITLTSNAGMATYQWLNCGSAYATINGETSQSYTPASVGSYAVEVTQNGCKDTSACYFITGTEIIKNDFGCSLIAWPNPTPGEINLSFSKKHKQVDIAVSNLVGQVIFTRKYEAEHSVDFKIESASGFYFVEIRTTDGKSAMLKVLKE